MGRARQDKMGWDKQNSFLTRHLFRSPGSKSIRGGVKQNGSNRIGQFTGILAFYPYFKKYLAICSCFDTI